MEPLDPLDVDPPPVVGVDDEQPSVIAATANAPNLQFASISLILTSLSSRISVGADETPVQRLVLTPAVERAASTEAGRVALAPLVAAPGTRELLRRSARLLAGAATAAAARFRCSRFYRSRCSSRRCMCSTHRPPRCSRTPRRAPRLARPAPRSACTARHPRRPWTARSTCRRCTGRTLSCSRSHMRRPTSRRCRSTRCFRRSTTSCWHRSRTTRCPCSTSTRGRPSRGTPSRSRLESRAAPTRSLSSAEASRAHREARVMPMKSHLQVRDRRAACASCASACNVACNAARVAPSSFRIGRGARRARDPRRRRTRSRPSRAARRTSRRGHPPHRARGSRRPTRPR